MTFLALDTTAIDAGWDAEAERSGVRRRVSPPPLYIALARELVAVEEERDRLGARAAEIRRLLGDCMGPGDRYEVDGGVVTFVSARLRGDEVIAGSGVRVERRRAGG
jgi:hypothetical protein